MNKNILEHEYTEKFPKGSHIRRMGNFLRKKKILLFLNLVLKEERQLNLLFGLLKNLMGKYFLSI